MMKLTRTMFICITAAATAASAVAQDGTEGTTVRPVKVEAKAAGCEVAEPGNYNVTVGDLIELDYTYPVVPGSVPDKVAYNQTLTGAVVKSPLGFRQVLSPRLVGAGTIAFYFEAKKEGEETVNLIIDGVEYRYDFKVTERAGGEN